MGVVGIALRGFGKALSKIAKKKPKQKSFKLKTDTKTKLKSILKNKPKGPAGKKFKSRMDVIKDSNKRAGTVAMLGTAGMVVGGGELLKRKKRNPRLRKSKP